MPDQAFSWMRRIKAVEREYGAIRFGTDRLIVAVNDDPSILEGQVARRDIGTGGFGPCGQWVLRSLTLPARHKDYCWRVKRSRPQASRKHEAFMPTDSFFARSVGWAV